MLPIVYVITMMIIRKENVMKKYAMVFVVCAAVILFVMGAAPTRSGIVRYEYAQFISSKTLAIWSTQDVSHAEISLEGLAAEMKMPYEKNKLGNLTLFNFVGNQGWELISVDNTRSEFTMYFFKRPK